MKPTGILKFDPEFIGEGLGLTSEQVKDWFHDGRNVSKVMEMNLANKLGFKLAATDDDHDLVDPDGKYWEVRCLTERGANFAPSNMTGAGRKFNMEGLIAKLQLVKGYVVADIQLFPDVPYWVLPVHVVEGWCYGGLLKRATGNRATISELLRNAFYCI